MRPTEVLCDPARPWVPAAIGATNTPRPFLVLELSSVVTSTSNSTDSVRASYGRLLTLWAAGLTCAPCFSTAAWASTTPSTISVRVWAMKCLSSITGYLAGEPEVCRIEFTCACATPQRHFGLDMKCLLD